MPHSPALVSVSQLRAGDPERRVRLLQRLGHDHAQRDVPDLALVLAGPVLEHRHDGAHGFLEDLALVLHGDAERLELGDRGALAHAELAAPVRQQVERRDPLGDAVGMVGRHLEDAVAQPDVLGPLAGRREEGLRARASGNTPRGSDARPATHGRSPAGRPARPGRARSDRADARRPASTDAGSCSS